MGALDGLRVIDAGILVQGPQAAALLGDLGAEVMKVELPDFGDQARWIPLSFEDFRSAFFVACNGGKRSITIDLRAPVGQGVFRRLADSADVVVTNFKPGTMESWGLDYARLSASNPRLVYAAGSAFGPLGPDACREGADLGGQASGGLISTTGVDGGPPTPVGATIADHIGAQNLVAGILAALLARERTGRGQQVDVSLLGSQIWAQASEYTHYFMTGRVPGRANLSHPLLPSLYGIFPTADGWLALVGVVPSQRPAFFEAIGHPELATDPRFTPLMYTPDVKAELFAIIADVFAERSTSEWCKVLTEAGQRFAPVRDYAEASDDPQVWANDYLIEIEHPEWGTLPMVGSPVRLSDTPAEPRRMAPDLGQHTEEILLELGYSWDEIGALRDAAAI